MKIKFFCKKVISVLFIISFYEQAFCQSSSPFKSQEAVTISPSGAKSAATGYAEQEFRRGVQAYNKGAFNDAILQFERALSYLPEENIILDWLGKAYYKSGVEGAALQSWQYASDAGYGGLLLKNRIEIVRERRIKPENVESVARYTEAGSFPGKVGDNLLFNQPVSLLSEPDGSNWILSYSTNELLKIDVNGLITFRSGGPVNGFDRPFDIIRLKNNNLLVSEFAGNRLALLNSKGSFIKYFGEKGLGVGQMIGPEYLAQDENNNIYVTDFGNSRVDVFDYDGNPLFYFGQKTADFTGFKSPTGIAVISDNVYVADSVKGCIYKFDTAGNYLGLLCRESTFKKPEAMKKMDDTLIICDSNKVYTIEVSSGAVFENISTGNAPSRVTCAVPDVNGNILVADFKSNEIYVMSRLSELVGGLFVQIERVLSDNFPKVTVDFKVENRSRQSIVGLKENNFLVTENKSPVLNYKFEGAVSANENIDVTLIIDRSVKNADYYEAINTSVKEIAMSMKPSDTLTIISAGQMPVLEYKGSPSAGGSFNVKLLKNPLTSNVALDDAVRFAANGLINGEKKRSIILVGTGTVDQNSFSKYALSDLICYLNNNSIGFINLMVSQGGCDREIDYLCSNTQGGQYYVYRKGGLSSIVDDIAAFPSGVYRISYTSQLETDFGTKYLPVEIETYLMNRSGRDETGYFAPLQ